MASQFRLPNTIAFLKTQKSYDVRQACSELLSCIPILVSRHLTHPLNRTFKNVIQRDSVDTVEFCAEVDAWLRYVRDVDRLRAPFPEDPDYQEYGRYIEFEQQYIRELQQGLKKKSSDEFGLLF